MGIAFSTVTFASRCFQKVLSPYLLLSLSSMAAIPLVPTLLHQVAGANVLVNRAPIHVGLDCFLDGASTPAEKFRTVFASRKNVLQLTKKMPRTGAMILLV